MKYSVECYIVGTFKIQKTVEVEANSLAEAEDIASDSFCVSRELIASNEDVTLEIDGHYYEYVAQEV